MENLRPTASPKVGCSRYFVCFEGKNSRFFDFPGFSAFLRSLRLPRELADKCGKTLTVRFGEPIMPDKRARHKDAHGLARFLRESTYALAPTKKQLLHILRISSLAAASAERVAAFTSSMPVWGS